MAAVTTLTAHTLPRNPQRNERSRQYGAYAEDHFDPAACDGKSLLRTVSRRLPAVAPTARSLLAKLVRERQGVYAAFLGRLMSGWSVSAAAVASSIRRESVRDWLAKGITDQQSDIDTFYARFATDVQAAIAFCVGECEIQVATRNPLEYLRTGPGRAFYAREQYWQPLMPGAPPPDDDLNPPAVIEVKENPRALSDQRLVKALAILRAQSVLSDPAFEQHVREQYAIDAHVVEPHSDQMDRSTRHEE